MAAVGKRGGEKGLGRSYSSSRDMLCASECQSREHTAYCCLLLGGRGGGLGGGQGPGVTGDPPFPSPLPSNGPHHPV